MYTASALKHKRPSLSQRGYTLRIVILIDIKLEAFLGFCFHVLDDAGQRRSLRLEVFWTKVDPRKPTVRVLVGGVCVHRFLTWSIARAFEFRVIATNVKSPIEG